MGLCPSSCGEVTLISNPQADCTNSLRKTTPSRIGFFTCTTDLPDPITDENIAPYFEDDSIVVSSPLANVVFNDPTTEDVIMDDCNVPQRIIVSRELTFEDRIAITAQEGSPAVAVPYKDYDFWQDKVDNQTKLNYMIIYCNGDVKVARDADGNLLTATILAFINYQKPTQSGGQSIEFKRLSILFQGDPLAMYNKPEFNLEEAGIEL